MDKKYDLICDQCGAMMKFNGTRTEMHCEYCGNIVLLPNTKHDEKIAYAKRKAEMDAQYEHSKKREQSKIKRERIAKLIAILFTVGLILIPISCTAIPYIFKPIVNPFDYIEVSFEGTDGEGTANIELVKTDEKIKSPDDFGITISKKYNLCEGETVTIYTDTFNSPYWHSQDSKEYVVEGLELYLTDLSDMDENVIKLINQKSIQILSKNIDDTPQIKINSHEKFYLISNGKQENMIYDVYNATWNLADGTEKQIYLAVYYTDIITHSGENATFSYDRCMYTGDILSTPDYRNNVVCGFESLEDVELELNTNRSPDMTLSEK